MRRRSRVQIVGDILRLGLAGKTEIMYSVNLTHTQLLRYLEFLSKRGLIYKDTESARIPQYYATEKGKSLLAEIDVVMRTLQLDEIA